MTFLACASHLSLGAFLASGIAQVSAPTTMQLEEAHRRGLVSIEIVGSGGSSGDVISVVVQRRVKRVLRLTLGTGTVLRSISPKIQNMVVATIKGLSLGDNKYRPTKVMELSDDASHTYLVEAYCLDFLKENPGPSDTFVLSGVDPIALRVIKAASGPGRPPSVIQAALWLDQGVSQEQIQERFPLAPTDWKAAQASIDSLNRIATGVRREPGPAPNQSTPSSRLLAEIDEILKTDDVASIVVKAGTWSGQTHLGQIRFVVANDGANITEIRFVPFAGSRCGSVDVTQRRLAPSVAASVRAGQFEFSGAFGTDAQFSMDGSFNQDGSQASGSWRLRVGIGNTCRGGWVATAPGRR